MGRTLRLALLVALMCLASRANAGVQLMDVVGFHFGARDESPAEWFMVGDEFEAMGYVPAVGPMLAPYHHPATHEYTFHFSGLVVSEIYFDPTEQLFGVDFANNARARFFEDARASGTPADFGVDPPNSRAPASFIDGDLLLGGDLDHLRLYYDFTYDVGGWGGAAELSFDEGRLYLDGVVNPCCGWSGYGYLDHPAETPEGYDGRLCGSFLIQYTSDARMSGSPCGIVPVARSTWGAIKKIYR